MARTTPIEKMDAELDEILNEYADNIAAGLDKAKIAVGKAGVQMIKQECRQFKGNGKYAKSWTYDILHSRIGDTVIIHSELYRLTHLLENGHAKVGKMGGYVQGYPHIKPVEEKIKALFEDKVRTVIRG